MKKKMLPISRLTFLILLLPSLGFSASLIGEIQTKEDLIELLEEEVITFDTYKDLSNLLIDRVDLNKDELTRLQLIPEIEEEDVLRIIKRRPFRSVEELLKVPRIDNDKFLSLKPFVRVSPPLPLRAELGSKISETLEDGSSAKLAHKLSLGYRKRATLCLKAEKEPEEDYEISYWKFRIKEIKRVKEGIAGDFKPHFGQKLVLGDWLRGALISLDFSGLEPAILYSELNSEELIGANVDFKGVGLTYYQTNKDLEIY
ncbi:helix-hairpin-helix domain-containing protein, partial [bacterium]|nr:helix-hairpin-helix domain-containing protein [bacterium]